MSCSYPIWNKIQACINEILIGTSAKNSHSFVRTRVTHKKHDDGTRTYHFYIDDKLYKKAQLKGKKLTIKSQPDFSMGRVGEHKA